MFKLFNDIKNIDIEIKKTKNIKEIEKLYIKYFGKKGIFRKINNLFKKIPKEKKPKIGKKINFLKNNIKNLFLKKKKKLKKNNNKNIFNYIDISLPGKNYYLYGNNHIITITINQIEKFFKNLGFDIIYGFEIEDCYHNFDALNIDYDHPSRTEKDTFWINKKYLLRTQTSCVQIRYMKKKKPPIKAITYGKVFRKDNDKTHTPMFNQLECFYVDKNISFSNLKYLINLFISFFFKKKKKIKFIPSYFPFTEPSAEVLIKYKNNKWLEILGCGMIHPKIFKNVNINYNIFSGFAFGLGIERLIMLKYNLSDIKIIYDNDIKFLNQF